LNKGIKFLAQLETLRAMSPAILGVFREKAQCHVSANRDVYGPASGDDAILLCLCMTGSCPDGNGIDLGNLMAARRHAQNAATPPPWPAAFNWPACRPRGKPDSHDRGT